MSNEFDDEMDEGAFNPNENDEFEGMRSLRDKLPKYGYDNKFQDLLDDSVFH